MPTISGNMTLESQSDETQLQITVNNPQTNNSIDIKNIYGTSLFNVDGTGNVSSQNITSTKCTINGASPTDVQLTVRAVASQSANILEVNNQYGSCVLSVSAINTVDTKSVNTTGTTTITGSGNNVELSVQSTSGQNVNIIEVKDSDSNELLSLDPYGHLNISNLHVAGTSDSVQVSVQPHGGQSSNAVEIKNTGGSTKINVDSSGNLVCQANTVINNLVEPFTYINFSETSPAFTYTVPAGGKNIVLQSVDAGTTTATFYLPCISDVVDGRTFTLVIRGNYNTSTTYTTTTISINPDENSHVNIYSSVPSMTGLLGDSPYSYAFTLTGAGTQSINVIGHVLIKFTAIGTDIVDSIGNQYIGKNWYVSY